MQKTNIESNDLNSSEEFSALNLNDDSSNLNAINEEVSRDRKKILASIEIKNTVLDLQKKYNFTDELCEGLRLLGEDLLKCKVVNTVCPLYISRTIDMEKLYANALKYNFNVKKHSKFTGISIKHCYDGKTFTAIYFKSGNINLVGMCTDNPEDISNVIRLLHVDLCRLLDEDLPDSANLKRKIANRVVSSKIPPIIKLDHLHLLGKTSYWKYTKYHDAIFPGAILRNHLNKVTCLFFKSGAIIITGIVNTRVLYETIIILLDRLGEYLHLRELYLAEQ